MGYLEVKTMWGGGAGSMAFEDGKGASKYASEISGPAPSAVMRPLSRGGDMLKGSRSVGSRE